jgi:tryptophanyl-tRNA synthetase
MHLGNYLGAVRRWVDEQHDEAIYCVVDLHAMTMPYDPAELTRLTTRMAAELLAAGLDAHRCTVFVQSHVAQHTELTWILNCVATVGELRRMTQFKDKSAGQESVSAGLFDYPVLMAADILLYDTDEVPVGDDQRQHVELTRDIALRFNHRFGDTFVVPVATFPPSGARVMDLQEPTKKMSASSSSEQGRILLLDPPSVVTKRIKSAVTDSDAEIRYDPETKPGVSNLLDILAAASGRKVSDWEAELAGQGYGALKTTTADAVVALLEPMQARYAELEADPAELQRQLATGAARATGVAGDVIDRARRAAGLLPPGG